jgi:hypothetical protein
MAELAIYRSCRFPFVVNFLVVASVVVAIAVPVVTAFSISAVDIGLGPGSGKGLGYRARTMISSPGLDIFCVCGLAGHLQTRAQSLQVQDRAPGHLQA